MGKMEYADGDVYTGQFRFGIPNGKGEMKFANGTSFKGQFVDGEPV